MRKKEERTAPRLLPRRQLRCDPLRQDTGGTGAGEKEVKVHRSVISFVPEVLARNPRGMAWKADKYMNLDKKMSNVPTTGSCAWRGQTASRQGPEEGRK